MIDLPEKFIERTKRTLGGDAAAFLASYDRKPYKAVRVNTLKLSVEQFKEIAPFELSPVEWEPNGFYVSAEKAGKTLLHFAGLYYVQEPSAMGAAPLLAVKAGERVLDMCSAPGGKGTQLAQNMNGEGIIVLNEIDFSRAKILSQNVERLGIANAAVTCASPEKLAEHFSGYFDKVLVDAPCSGEGMFLKEPNAVKEWSESNIALCAKRQESILDCAALVLRAGGLLVYSTCTFAPEEDEEQIENFLRKYPDFTLIHSKKLLPHTVKGEGHFVALFKKNDGEEGYVKPFVATFADKKRQKIYREFESDRLFVSFDNLHLVGDVLYSLPKNLPCLPFQLLRAGVRLGEFKGDRFQPDHSLAMGLKPSMAKSVDLDEETAKKYLEGNTFACSEKLSGWMLVTYLGYPLGWCKAVGGIAKNHLPKGLRI